MADVAHAAETVTEAAMSASRDPIDPIDPIIPTWFRETLELYLGAWQKTMTPRLAASYWDTLRVLPQDAVELAAAELRRAGGRFVPSASEWYQHAVSVARRQSGPPVAQPAGDRPICRRCRDTGWAPYRCLGVGQTTTGFKETDAMLPVRACRRSGTHVPHVYVIRCDCARQYLPPAPPHTR